MSTVRQETVPCIVLKGFIKVDYGKIFAETSQTGTVVVQWLAVTVVTAQYSFIFLFLVFAFVFRTC